MENIKPTSNEAENGNKSKPLLADSGFDWDLCMIYISMVLFAIVFIIAMVI